MNIAYYLCFLVLTGMSKEKVYVNVNNILFYEREHSDTARGKEQLTRMHMVDKTVISVRETIEEISKKTHRCKDEMK